MMRKFITALTACAMLVPASFVKVQADDGYVWIDMPVEFRESEAREMLYYVNEFRTGSDAWAWEKGDASKKYYNCEALTYDYGLEEIAMQRAVELIASYGHTRADGLDWKQTYADCGYQTYTNAENIAYFYGPGAEGTVEAFREDDYGYGGQGHRRNMLDERFKYFGGGCIRYEDKYFYVQEFSDRPLNQNYSSPRDYDSWDSARFKRSEIGDWKMEHDSVTVRIGSSGKVYDINRQMFNFRKIKYLICGWDQSYTSDNSSIVSTSGINYSANSIGTTTLYGPSGMGGQTLSFEVHVTNQYEPVRWNWSDDLMTASLELQDVNSGMTVTANAKISVSYDEEPTCSSYGYGTFTATVYYEGETYTDKKFGYIPALGHDWGKPTYTWDGAKCTGTVKCLRDSSHTETQTVTASRNVIKAATCTSKGSAQYTATFYAPFTTQTKTAEIPMRSHSLTDVTYKWANDYSTCTAAGKCENCGKTVTETVKTTSSVVKEATETESGRMKYFAEFKTLGFKSRSITVPFSAAQKKTAMYRLYNPNSYEHFYTGNAKEKDALVKMGWKYEGIGWYAPKSSKTPVYRLYNPNNGGDHHYTKNKKEYDALTKAGWKGEGIRWYSDDAKGVPVYREYNPGQPIRNHNYTANKKEHDYLVKTAGWKNEGIGWYGVK